MKELLYRGKRKKDGKWIYGNIVTSFPSGQVYIGGYNDDNYLVDKLSVSQYIYKTDKKSNKIFINDIVKYKRRYCAIHYFENCCWIIGKDIFEPVMFVPPRELKICDNGFDNPKRLKKIFKEFRDNHK